MEKALGFWELFTKMFPLQFIQNVFLAFPAIFLPAFYASLSNLILSCFALSFNSYQIHYLVKAPTKLLDFTSLQLICGCSFAAFPLVCLRYPSPFSVLFSWQHSWLLRLLVLHGFSPVYGYVLTVCPFFFHNYLQILLYCFKETSDCYPLISSHCTFGFVLSVELVGGLYPDSPSWVQWPQVIDLFCCGRLLVCVGCLFPVYAALRKEKICCKRANPTF